MKQKNKNMEQPANTNNPDSKKSQEGIKASHLSSNPINEDAEYKAMHFESEVRKAFMRVFNLNF